MTPEDRDEFRALIREERPPCRECRAPEPASAPPQAPPQEKRHHLVTWIAGISAALATAAVIGVVDSWRNLSVVEDRVESARKDIGTINAKLDTIGTKIDQLIGRDSLRPAPAPVPGSR